MDTQTEEEPSTLRDSNPQPFSFKTYPGHRSNCCITTTTVRFYQLAQTAIISYHCWDKLFNHSPSTEKKFLRAWYSLVCTMFEPLHIVRCSRNRFMLIFDRVAIILSDFEPNLFKAEKFKFRFDIFIFQLKGPSWILKLAEIYFLVVAINLSLASHRDELKSAKLNVPGQPQLYLRHKLIQ